MSFVFHRYLDREMPTIVRGEGNYLIDSNGKRYLDGCCGAAVSCLGHSNERVQQAVQTQMQKVSFAHTGFFTNEPAEALGEFLVKHATDGTGDGLVIFLGSGSEAMEAALKLARQTHLERGEPGRNKVIARDFSYHGNTLGALAIGGHAGRRAPFDPLLVKFDHIDPCYAYRQQRVGEGDAEFGLRMANLLEERLQELGPETVSAFVAEPVVGATLGSQTAATGYFKRIRQICDQHGVLFIADEVMCGMGRTGSLFALEQEGIHADITTIAKGLGAGFQPIAAVVAAQMVADAVRSGSRRLWNGHTYMSHSAACAGAYEVMKIIQEEDLIQTVQKTGEKLASQLRETFGTHANIGDIRGRGLFWSIEFVEDRDTKKPFDSAFGLTHRVQNAALERGLMCYPSAGCADGTNGDLAMLAPAFTTTQNEVELMVGTLSDAVEAALGNVGI